ncbi:Ribonuclease H [Arachis hypogaea]|nr:Ribonuclease H [Arachis hypogaea]
MDTGRFIYYVVRRGRKLGIYTSWEECNRQVFGFKGSEHKGFMVRSEAKSWLELRNKDPEGEKTIMGNQELAVRFGDLKVGDSISVEGDGSSGSGTAATNLLLHELDIAPKFDPTSFVIMEDMEQVLFRVCAQLEVGPLVFFLRDGFRMEGKNYHGFGVSLQSHVKGINFFVSGRVSTDERLARQDASFITLERLLEEAELKIFDFNYQVTLRYKEEVAEAQRLARMSVPKRVMILEKENAELKHRLGVYNQMFR